MFGSNLGSTSGTLDSASSGHKEMKRLYVSVDVAISAMVNTHIV